MLIDAIMLLIPIGLIADLCCYSLFCKNKQKINGIYKVLPFFWLLQHDACNNQKKDKNKTK